ncbi:MAG: hypothetical protein F9K40_06945 [Kofleriaceae bacterium]|nr:MAG: hypothetical protein F9K40_06945 [Kofleriaceae bacterium]MBZ0238579.1 hypothetical protein [Kofleriaceae bacterium]
MRYRIACLLVVVGCGGSALKEAGEECVASSECAAGLVCDLGASPPVCAGNVTADALEVDAPDEPIDAADPDGAETDAATIDARVIDAQEIDAPMIDAGVDADETDAAPDA